MWSLGVIAFVILTGSMPFEHPNLEQLVRAVKKGKYPKEKLAHLSSNARHFVTSLLVMSPEGRLTAEQAIRHPWIQEHCSISAGAARHETELDDRLADALLAYSKESYLRRALRIELAWSLRISCRLPLLRIFEELDTDCRGEISLSSMEEIIQTKLQISNVNCAQVMKSLTELDMNEDGKIGYTETLSAIMQARVWSNHPNYEILLRNVFRRLDHNDSGYWTPESFEKLYERYPDQAHRKMLQNIEIDEFFQEADYDGDGKVSLQDFMMYWRQTS